MYFIVSKADKATVLAQEPSRVKARAMAKELGGTVKTEAPGAAPAAPASKKKIAQPKTKAKSTRAETSPDVLAKGKAALQAAVKAELNKVGIVRAVSGVKGLQRRDVFALIQAHNLGIADATISTQYQVTRSGKA